MYKSGRFGPFHSISMTPEILTKQRYVDAKLAEKVNRR